MIEELVASFISPTYAGGITFAITIAILVIVVIGVIAKLEWMFDKRFR
jgi:hypothetical protein